MANNIRVGKYCYSNSLLPIGKLGRVKREPPGTWVEIIFAQNGVYRKTKTMLPVLLFIKDTLIWSNFKWYIFSDFLMYC